MTKTDTQIKQDVELELRFDPSINAAKIGVTVDNGAVSLLGGVDTYAQKWAAEAAAKRVGGVRILATDLKVELLADHARSDPGIAAAIQSALAWNVQVPKSILAKVQDGWVTLEGECVKNYQREAAELAVRCLVGVVGVSNGIALVQQTSETEIKLQVEAALQRQAKSDAKSIVVATSGGKVTLSGHASSWQAIEDAAAAAWTAPGVTQVQDNIQMQ